MIKTYSLVLYQSVSSTGSASILPFFYNSCHSQVKGSNSEEVGLAEVDYSTSGAAR